MQVEVLLFGGLEKMVVGAKYSRPVFVELPAGSTVADLIRWLGIPEQNIFSVLVNGRHAEQNQVLQLGDRAALFPPLAGG